MKVSEKKSNVYEKRVLIQSVIHPHIGIDHFGGYLIADSIREVLRTGTNLTGKLLDPEALYVHPLSGQLSYPQLSSGGSLALFFDHPFNFDGLTPQEISF